MRTFLLAGVAVLVFASNTLPAQTAAIKPGNQQLATLVSNYYEENVKLNPVSATVNADNRYNDLLYNDLTDSFHAANRQLCHTILVSLRNIDRVLLSNQDQVTYDILKRELEMSLEGFCFHRRMGIVC